MKNLTTVMFMGLFAASYAQTDISIWQETHPEITFIEQADFNQLTDDQKVLIQKSTIVYNQEIKQSDILAFENKKQSQHPNAIFNYSDLHAQEIKNWLGQNQEIIKIQQSEFDNLSMDRQAELIEAKALVYSGNFLTLNDIISYEESH